MRDSMEAEGLVMAQVGRVLDGLRHDAQRVRVLAMTAVLHQDYTTALACVHWLIEEERDVAQVVAARESNDAR